MRSLLLMMCVLALSACQSSKSSSPSVTPEADSSALHGSWKSSTCRKVADGQYILMDMDAIDSVAGKEGNATIKAVVHWLSNCTIAIKTLEDIKVRYLIGDQVTADEGTVNETIATEIDVTVTSNPNPTSLVPINVGYAVYGLFVAEGNTLKFGPPSTDPDERPNTMISDSQTESNLLALGEFVRR